jgi:hypothetical protein
MQDFAKQKNYMQDVNRERGKFDPTISQTIWISDKLNVVCGSVTRTCNDLCVKLYEDDHCNQLNDTSH